MPGRTTATIVLVAVLAAACASPTVATANGVDIREDEVTALNSSYAEEIVYSGESFRRDLSLLVVNAILATTAEEDFGITGLADPDAIADKIADPSPEEQAVLDNLATDPFTTPLLIEVAAAYFVIREAVFAELAPGASLVDQGAAEAFNAWAGAAVAAAEVDIASPVGVWGGAGSGIEPPR